MGQAAQEKLEKKTRDQNFCTQLPTLSSEWREVRPLSFKDRFTYSGFRLEAPVLQSVRPSGLAI
jgi:hypothetical protein